MKIYLSCYAIIATTAKTTVANRTSSSLPTPDVVVVVSSSELHVAIADANANALQYAHVRLVSARSSQRGAQTVWLPTRNSDIQVPQSPSRPRVSMTHPSLPAMVVPAPHIAESLALRPAIVVMSLSTQAPMGARGATEATTFAITATRHVRHSLVSGGFEQWLPQLMP